MQNQILNFDGREITLQLDDNGEPWFPATEVASILGYATPRDAIITHVDDEDVAKRDSLTARTARNARIQHQRSMDVDTSPRTARLAPARSSNHQTQRSAPPEMVRASGEAEHCAVSFLKDQRHATHNFQLRRA